MVSINKCVNLLFLILLCSSFYCSFHSYIKHSSNSTTLNDSLNNLDTNADFIKSQIFVKKARKIFFKKLALIHEIKETEKNISNKFNKTRKRYEHWLEDLKKKQEIKHSDYNEALKSNLNFLKKQISLEGDIEIDENLNNKNKTKFEGKVRACNKTIKHLRHKLENMIVTTKSASRKTNELIKDYKHNVAKIKKIHKNLKREINITNKGNKTSKNETRIGKLNRKIKNLNKKINKERMHLNHQAGNSEYLNQKLDDEFKIFNQTIINRTLIENSLNLTKHEMDKDIRKDQNIKQAINLTFKNINKIQVKLQKSSNKIQQVKHVEKASKSNSTQAKNNHEHPKINSSPHSNTKTHTYNMHTKRKSI